ncbi:MAG: WavE lipopolysaccharide synthesis family protein [Sulfurovaceae bacterium]|nr:WavE lipopolysaccharide synthesis family protein [Sulfurovaceae bacterium]
MKLSSFLRKENYSIKKITDRALVFFFEKKGGWEGFFYTLHKRPRYSDMVKRNSVIIKPEEKITIVMQGPIMIKDNFTFETLKLYKKMYSGVDIILSTWKNESPGTIEKIKDLGIMVIENEKPAFAGPYNVNLQIESSKNGLLRAKHQGAEFAIKTRTDQRMYNPDSVNLFLMLHYQYPPDKTTNQKGRLFSINTGVIKYKLYCVGDMMFFGQIDEMIDYWSCLYDMRTLVIPPELTTFEVSRLTIAETYLTVRYLEKIGHEVLWTVEDSWQVYGKYFCIIDQSLFDMFWNKYNSYTEYKSRFYTVNHNYESITYADWLAAYMNRPLNIKQLRVFYNIREGGSLEKPKDFTRQE